MINNRQNGRRRGRGSSSQRPTGSSQGQRDSGNRIDSRARGNAAQLLEKYKNMARDAQMQGDRVNTEYYLQFADHYFRVLSDSRVRQDDHRPIRPVDDFDGSDEEYGDEGEPIRSGEQAGDAQRQSHGNPSNATQSNGGQSNGGQQGGNRDYAPRHDGNRDYQPRDSRDGIRGDSRTDNRNDGARREYQPRDTQPRDQQPRDYAPRESSSRDEPRRDYQSRDRAPRDPQMREAAPRDPASGYATEANGQSWRPAADAAAGEEATAAPKPERKPRTRKPAAPVTAEPEFAEAAHAFDADRLPPAIAASAPETADPEDAPKPKRRRGRPPAGEVQTG